MPGRLSDQVIVVTGATGIAAASARLFAAEGAKVHVVSRDANECEALASAITDNGGVCEWTAADLTDEVAAEKAFAATTRLGPLDGMLAVAGGSGRPHGDGPLHSVPLAGWEATFRDNATPAFLAAREAVRYLVGSNRRGSIVIVSSVLALHPSPALFATHAYAAAKGSALSMVVAMASYYAPRGIRVNAITPGLIDTPMTARAASDPTTMEYAARKQPLVQGMIRPEDVAWGALFLLSDESTAITGQVLNVDGGWSVTDASTT